VLEGGYVSARKLKVQALDATSWDQTDTGAKGCRRTLRTWQSRQRAITTARRAAATTQLLRTSAKGIEAKAADAGYGRLNPMNIDIVDRRLSGRDAGVCLSKSNSDVKPLW
jgi:hypothetical protein